MSEELPDEVVLPPIGILARDEELKYYVSSSAWVPIFTRDCTFVIDRLSDMRVAEADYQFAIKSFVELQFPALQAIEAHVFQYYLDLRAEAGDIFDMPEIASASGVWKHVQFGSQIHVQRRDKDGRIYLSIECECGWEPEHGLEIVFCDGREVSKVGPWDGHLTNADAFDDPDLENVVYVSHWQAARIR